MDWLTPDWKSTIAAVCSVIALVVSFMAYRLRRLEFIAAQRHAKPVLAFTPLRASGETGFNHFVLDLKNTADAPLEAISLEVKEPKDVSIFLFDEVSEGDGQGGREFVPPHNTGQNLVSLGYRVVGSGEHEEWDIPVFVPSTRLASPAMGATKITLVARYRFLDETAELQSQFIVTVTDHLLTWA